MEHMLLAGLTAVYDPSSVGVAPAACSPRDNSFVLDGGMASVCEQLPAVKRQKSAGVFTGEMNRSDSHIMYVNKCKSVARLERKLAQATQSQQSLVGVWDSQRLRHGDKIADPNASSTEGKFRNLNQYDIDPVCKNALM